MKVTSWITSRWSFMFCLIRVRLNNLLIQGLKIVGKTDEECISKYNHTKSTNKTSLKLWWDWHVSKACIGSSELRRAWWERTLNVRQNLLCWTKHVEKSMQYWAHSYNTPKCLRRILILHVKTKRWKSSSFRDLEVSIALQTLAK